MTVTPFSGTVPLRTQTQAAFDTNMAEFVAWIATIPAEINADVAAINASSGAGALVIAYTFSTTTTDSDPGNGVLRLNQATQNTATVIRADLLDNLGVDATNVLAEFDNSSNTIKGYIRLVKASDTTKWLLFSVTSMASPAGYRNITVACVASSAASPFANSDALVLYFTRAGDIVGGAGDHAVEASTGNGFGSTNTKIRRYTTSATTGTAITYADSATLGASFTINSTGLYEIYMVDDKAAGSGIIGASVNTTQPTITIESITAADRLLMASQDTSSASSFVSISRVVKLTAGDVVRPHTSGDQDSTSAATSLFSIRRIGSI